METTKEFIAKSVPRLDHPVLNSLHNASVTPINVPVTLCKNKAPVFSAEVKMLGTCLPQYNAALYFTLQALRDNDVGVEWDACCFLSGSPLRPKAAFDDLAHNDRILKHLEGDKERALRDVFAQAHDTLSVAIGNTGDETNLKSALDIYAERIAAALIRETVTLSSADLNAAISAQPLMARGKRYIASIFR
jgi:hypothetical protein